MVDIKENELILFTVFDNNNEPIGKTELIKTIFLFSELVGLQKLFKFTSDIYGPNELDGCISAEINRHRFIISDYRYNKNIYYFDPKFFEKYNSNFIEKINQNSYLKLLNNMSYFMKGGRLPLKIALIYTIFPEYTKNSTIKEDLRPFFINKSLLNRNLKYLLLLIPHDIFGQIFERNKERLKPFIFLDQNNLNTLIDIISSIIKSENYESVYSSINHLISNVNDYNYKYLLESILFIIKRNPTKIKEDSEIKKSIIISLLKLNFETERKMIRHLMNIAKEKDLDYSILV